MSSKFLILIFMILVSVQLSCSLGWSLWPNEASEPPLLKDTPNFPTPMNSDKSSEDSLVQTTLANIENVKTSTSSSDRYGKWSLWGRGKSEEVAPEQGTKEEFTSSSDEYTEEEFTKSPKSEKETQSIPSTSTSSSDKIVVYVSTVSTLNTDSSTPTTEESESGSSTTTISTTSTTTESSLDVTVANNVYRSVDEGSPDSDGTLIEKSSPSSTDDNVNNENSGTNNSTEFTFPNVTYSENPKKANSSIDEENENMESEKTIERKDKETHASREVPDVNNQNSGVNNSKESTVNDDAGSSTPITESSPTDMAITPAATENTLNSTYVNRDVNSDTENYDNSSKSEIVSDLDQSSSIQANATIKTILSTSTDTVNTTEMAGSMSNGTTPEVNFGSFVNSGSTSNAFSQLIFNLCILIFSISVIV